MNLNYQTMFSRQSANVVNHVFIEVPVGCFCGVLLAIGGGSTAFVEIGNTIGIDLKITTLLGWFVLASLLVNEIRSIIENFVEAGFNVPIVLTKGLEVADKAINQEQEKKSE